ncbi:MAG TPA: DNA-processing protein DprA [bacterium]|nr:DNA-processing protein DprA [bacterium]HPR86466.1 DNA-processing protein DprA [bacterium]
MTTATAELLSLWNTPGVGPQRLRSLIDRFGSGRAVYAASVRQLCEVEGVDQATAAKIKSHADLAAAEEQLRLAQSAGVTVLTFWDERYPAMLRPLYDPPMLLFVQGELEVLAGKAVAVVGTRAPSEYGQIIAQKLTRELVQRGLVIVSGLARGIDTIAHQETIAQGGKTVAVLGSGVDQIYPSENRRLAGRITASGALVSEYVLGTQPDAPHFPRRNRIIAGLTVATLVVEAGESSGALITADNALEYNREVLAVPGNVTNPKSWGCNRLIQQGAKLVQTVEDLLVEIGMAETPPPERQLNLPGLGLSADAELLLKALSAEPQHIDAIAQQLGKPVFVVLAQLLELELQNLVTQLPGKKFVRV